MTTPIAITGGTTVFGTAPDNSGTDSFLVYGAANTIVEGGGNLVVNGGNLAPYGWDTNTTILLGNADMVNDQITLDGNANTIMSQVLYQSTVSINVTGLGLTGSPPGDNAVSLDNEQGTTTLKLAGTHDNVTLNGDAANSIRLGGGYGTVSVGGQGDALFGYATSLKLGGSHNIVTGGDENFTINGGIGYDTVSLGDGNNTVKEQGTHNAITVWGGTNIIAAGSGSDTVNILGTNGLGGAYFVYNPSVPIAGPPTDSISLGGSNDAVNATYENVDIYGVAVTGNAKINLGNGNNEIDLAGVLSAIALGNGTNNVELTGNSNSVTVTDPTGIGTDNVTVGLGANNVVSLDYAGGSVAGTGLGLTTVTQAAGSGRVVNVNLNNGIGAITVGDGNDSLTANGNGTTITAGDGSDVINANGGGASVTAGNGADTVNANGSGAHVVVGNGNDVINANGGGASVVAGNGSDFINANGAGASVTAGYGNDTVNANGGSSTVTLGAGNDVVSATGPGSSVTIAGAYYSTDNVTVGSSDYVRVSNSTASVSGLTDNSIYVNGLQANSNILAAGANNMVFIASDSDVTVQLNQAEAGNALTVQADAGNTYGGVVVLSDFNTGDTLSLQGLIGGVTGQAINSYIQVLENITAGPVSDTLHLFGGGAIVFDAVTPFKATEFTFGSNTGPV